MTDLHSHPTVVAVERRAKARGSPQPMLAEELRRLCLECGADDVGFVSLTRPEIDDQRAEVLKVFGGTRLLISVVCRMNREPIRSVSRAVANLEFHQTTDHVNEVCRAIVGRLDSIGISALNPAAGFPMEMSSFPGKVWHLSHKPVAVAAGLGRMGIHRNVIHPRFGNLILLGTVLVAADIDKDSVPIDYNPCLSCKLCVAACPVGAIKTDGRFDFSACMTHNYREFMGGFTHFVEQVADAKNARDLRAKVTDGETASMWQSLSFGANYKAAYCLAVCPAGEDVISPFLTDRKDFIAQTLKPLQQKSESVYVVANSDAEDYVTKTYPHKATRRVGGLRPSTIEGFLFAMPHVFQPGQAGDLNAVYHFDFTGKETAQATVTIRNKQITVARELIGKADCAVRADSSAWLGFLRKDTGIVLSILRRKIRVKGQLSLLQRFGKCFPS